MLGARFDQALLYAHALHRTQQRRDSGVPYVAHLLAVTALALEHGADEDMAIAALLHDAVEDQGGMATAAAIHERFGTRVHALVLALSDATTTPKPPWRARKQAYLQHLADAGDDVRLLSACDKLHNARSIAQDHAQVGPRVWQRFRGGRDGTLWYYRQLCAVFATRGPAALAAQLGEIVAHLHTLP